MYSLSTCWNSARHTDGRAMLREIRELGFDYAELSHGIRLSLVPGILEAVKAGEIKISSLHNFCPLPVGVTGASPNLYEFSSARERDRQLAVKHTLNTLDFAQRVGAPLVVLHFGSMDLKDYTGKLKELLERGEKGTPKFLKVVAEANAARAAKKKKFYDHSRDTLRSCSSKPRRAGSSSASKSARPSRNCRWNPTFRRCWRNFPRRRLLLARCRPRANQAGAGFHQPCAASGVAGRPAGGLSHP
jgi:hypothetical protein